MLALILTVIFVILISYQALETLQEPLSDPSGPFIAEEKASCELPLYLFSSLMN